MRRRLGFAAILLAALFVLAACDANSELVGRWRRWAEHYNSAIGTQIYVFNRGGEGFWHDLRILSDIPHGLHEIPITWNVSGDRLEIFFDGQPMATTYYFRFADEDTLIIRGVDWPEGTGSVLTRLDD